MAKLSKKQKGYAADIDRSRDYSVAEAAEIIKTGATAKFDETIEIAINLGVDPRHADQMVRGAVAMPN
ncbi:MAG: 50S ribosomal protein L1, partial [Candidatus Puniceispirillaceae bacterium]